MQAFRRKLNPLTFAENQPRSLELPRNFCMRHLSLWLDGEATIAGGATAGTPRDSSPAQLIKRIEIVRDGSETLKAIDFETLHRLTQRRYRTRPRIDSLPAGFGAIADEPIECHARLNFAMWPGHFRPVDTMLDCSRCTTLHMIVTFGAAADIMDSDFDGTVSVSGVQLKTATLEMANVPADWIFNDFKEHVLQKQVTAAADDFEFPNLANGNFYRGFTIKTTRDGIPTDGIIKEITLKSGTRVFAKLVAEQLQFDNRIDSGVEMPVANDSIDRVYLERILTGYYYIDLCPDGRLMESLATKGLSSLEFVMNVNDPGANTDYVFIYPEELVLAPVKEAPK